MNVSKIIEAISELEGQRQIIDKAIEDLRLVAASLAGDSPALESRRLEQSQTVSRSYIDDAVFALKEAGRPLHVTELVALISKMRGESISRPSVESSIVRHIKGATVPKLAKTGKSTYAVADNKPNLSLAS